MRKFVQEQLTEIERFTTQVIPGIIENEGSDPDDYNEARMQLNKVIIQACIGGEFKKTKKGDNRISFTKKLPTTKELSKMVDMMDTFIRSYELPYLKDMAIAESEDDDIEIPSDNELIELAIMGTGINSIEKINGKKLTNYIFGKDGCEPVMKYILNTSDIIKLASIGKDLRKKRNRNLMLMAGGIALVVTGGVAFAVYKSNKNKNDIDDIIDEIDVDDIDVDEIDVDVDADEAPVVELD